MRRSSDGSSDCAAFMRAARLSILTVSPSKRASASSTRSRKLLYGSDAGMNTPPSTRSIPFESQP